MAQVQGVAVIHGHRLTAAEAHSLQPSPGTGNVGVIKGKYPLH